MEYNDQWILESVNLNENFDLHRFMITFGKHSDKVEDYGISKPTYERMKKYCIPYLGDYVNFGDYFTYSSNAEAKLVQRRFNAIFKIYYTAGIGLIEFMTKKNTEMMTVNGKTQPKSTAPAMRAYILDIYHKCENPNITNGELIELFKNVMKNKDILGYKKKDGILYVIKDFDKNGNEFYKIGETNKNKGAEGRLNELKRTDYLSSKATILIDKEHNEVTMLEAYLHLRYFDKKIECPNRPATTNYTEYRSQCDETFRLTPDEVKDLEKTIEIALY